ncbi:MAG: 16S rRNA (guanine(527)-N(7))-methyltransferase RsmG [Clostridium sp.]
MSYFEIMKVAANDVDMDLTQEQYDRFIKYMRLVQEWNNKVNLTAITEDDEFIQKHFIDCIKAFKCDELKKASTLIDVGTGAGFPGLPIAIMREDLKVTLLDSLNKRINFLNLVVRELGLKNVTTIHSRAEDGAKEGNLRQKFDISTSRAVANMTVLSEFCIPYVKVGGHFLALKGPLVDEELMESKNAIRILGGNLVEVKEVSVENTDLRHNLVLIKKVKDTPSAYPRKAGMVTKKPLK